MISLYSYGKPFNTEAVVEDLPVAFSDIPVGTVCAKNNFNWTYKLNEKDAIYGLGETVRGINKRGWIYISNASDDFVHTEGKSSLYSAHNFIIISGPSSCFGLFFDYPSNLTFDIAYSHSDIISVSCDRADIKIYYIDGTDELDIVKQFRHIIGPSFIPPKFAFGFGQSRWGYKTSEDFKSVVRKHRENHIPMDMLYMDIDYMDSYKDFTVNPEEFSDFENFVSEMKEDNIHLVPIIDAGVKIEKDYPVYEEGMANGYFVKDSDGNEFSACVWPGMTHFPDFLNKDARKWFGDKYDYLISKGIDAFWNDMNEPSIFYSAKGQDKVLALMKDIVNGKRDDIGIHELADIFNSYKNSEEDYRSFYHNVDGQLVRHDLVHNLFGYNMTRAAGEAFERLSPDKRILMFSRSSYIGMHRYGGIWTGDNRSWWSHLLLNLQQLPAMSMCGFLYSGADCGGFGDNTTRDLLLRWMALSVFTPLFRNHSCLGTRYQEFYQFEGPKDFRAIVEARYRLIPYLYSEFMKAALNDEMLFIPLSFVYRDDPIARECEDQLMLGSDIMIAPVYKQNASGRTVYLPEEMMFVKLCPEGKIVSSILPSGLHNVEIAINEVSFFIRNNHCIPLADSAECVDAIDYSTIKFIGYENSKYELYNDDGVSRIPLK